jgi:hypothetical protein
VRRGQLPEKRDSQKCLWKPDLHDYFKIAGNRRISDDERV